MTWIDSGRVFISVIMLVLEADVDVSSFTDDMMVVGNSSAFVVVASSNVNSWFFQMILDARNDSML